MRAARSYLLSMVLAQSAMAGDADQAAHEADGPDRLFARAHDITRGWDFGASACDRAHPLLAAAVVGWAQVSEPQRLDGFAQFQLAKCEQTHGELAAAARRLRALLDRPYRPELALVLDKARLSLADMLASGQGGPPDPERALALYLLVEPQTPVAAQHRDRAAAELVFALNGHRGSPLFHQLLEQGSSADNWWRSISVRSAANENRYALARLRLAAVRASDPWPLDATEKEALERLRLEASEDLLRTGDLALRASAIGLLQAAGGEEASRRLATMERSLPARIVFGATPTPGTGEEAALAQSRARPPVAPFETSWVATWLNGSWALGDAVPLTSSPGDWVLLSRAAEMDSEGRLVEARGGRQSQLVWLRLRAPAKSDPDRRPRLEVEALLDIADLRGEDGHLRWEADDEHPPCVHPEGAPSLGYEGLAGSFRLLWLDRKHRLLVASVGRSEGYAGGGGDFSGELLFEARDGRLAAVACYAVSRSQMFAGEWNRNGTRQHVESAAAWRLRVRPGRDWPALWLQPTTPGNPGAMLVWDPAHQYYVAAP